MINDNIKKETELNNDEQDREMKCLRDLVKRQHHIIDYLENRLYCALIDADYAD